MVSCQGGSNYAILTIRELKSRKRWYSRIENLKAETGLAVARGFFRSIPAHMRKTLTTDNGSENALLKDLEELFLGFKVYVCDPCRPWQRGSVEQANQEFRFYYPKGTDFKNISHQEVWQTEDKINRRRMDCLGGKTANEVFEFALKNPPLIQMAGKEVLSSRKALLEAIAPQLAQKSGLFLPSQYL